MLQSILITFISAVFINNFVVVKFLGICPFLGVSKKIKTAAGMGAAVIFVMTLASAAAWLVQEFILKPLDLEYMQTIAFILVIAALVQFVEMVLQKTSQGLYKALGIYLPLITTNCAVLGVTLLNVESGNNFLISVFNGAFSGVGFTLAIVLFAGIRERLETAVVPKCLQGFPISLISASLVSLAFLGFQGLLK
ncbi:MAG TPA: electron transport complex subunit RsxA [Clostridia bacterium]|nr:electron transport complex subunit RsxA [Clostridia bacterium]